MDHVAIMKKSLGLTEKILSGEKTIESRWYKFRRDPWGKISLGDRVFFKNTGEKVSVVSEVEKVLQFDELNSQKINSLLDEYGKEVGIDDKLVKFKTDLADKKFCILIYLKNSKSIEPFEIDKTGYGAMCAWITVNDINTIKKL